MEDRIDNLVMVSLKHRLKNSISSCFKHRSNPVPLHHQFDEDPSSTTTHHHHPRLVRSSSGGGSTTTSRLRSYRSGSDDLTHIKDKCLNLIGRISTPRPHHRHIHRKSHSTDFHYDPLSYALNFDDGAADDDPCSLDDLPLRNFAARLPRSPTPPPSTELPSDVGASSRGITAYS